MSYIVVDVGGTSIKYGTASQDGKLSQVGEVPTEASKGSERILTNLENVIAELMNSKVRGIGIGLPGVIDYAKQMYIEGPNVPLRNEHITRRIEKKFGLPTIIDNDANIAALGENWRGAGRGVKDMILLTLGTGLGGGIIVDHHIYRGTTIGAGEVGHIIVSGRNITCSSGHKGCLEGLVSARVLLRQARNRIRKDIESAEDVYRLAKQGNKRALDLFTHMGEQLSRGLASLIHVFGPEKIVIGGGFARSWDLLVKPAIDDLPNHTFDSMRKHTRIVHAKLGNHAGLVGAARLAREECDGKKIA